MPNYLTCRLNLHVRPGADRISWALLVYSPDRNGVPQAHLQSHGAVDLHDQDAVGIDALALMLARAVDQAT